MCDELPPLPANDEIDDRAEDARPGCRLCPDEVTRSPMEMLDHLRVLHPHEYGDGPEMWPDGGIVVYDADPDPDDIRE